MVLHFFSCFSRFSCFFMFFSDSLLVLVFSLFLHPLFLPVFPWLLPAFPLAFAYFSSLLLAFPLLLFDCSLLVLYPPIQVSDFEFLGLPILSPLPFFHQVHLSNPTFPSLCLSNSFLFFSSLSEGHRGRCCALPPNPPPAFFIIAIYPSLYLRISWFAFTISPAVFSIKSIYPALFLSVSFSVQLVSFLF